jgi:hypothetical protein
MRCIVLILLLPAVLLGQQHFGPENIFGLDIPVVHWGDDADAQYMGAPNTGLLGVPIDAASLYFASGSDTTQVILILDRMTNQIRFIRIDGQGSQNHIQYISNFSGQGPDLTSLSGPSAIAVSSAGRTYDEEIDRIFVADKMNHRLAKFNFHFNHDFPQNDYIEWESSANLDTLFFPVDLKYIICDTFNINSNKIIAIDDNDERLAIFSNSGDLQYVADVHAPADSVNHLYSTIEYVSASPDSIMLYMTDRASCSIRSFFFDGQNSVNYQNQIFLGDLSECKLANVIYHPSIGLWALDSGGPYIYSINLDLSGEPQEIPSQVLDIRLSYNPQRMIILPGRLLVFEEISNATGVMTFCTDPSFGKRQSGPGNTLPLVFSLNPNYPNPFNPNTTINFSVPTSGWVKLEIFNILGQKVKTLANDNRQPGKYSVNWDGLSDSGGQVASGIYLAKLSTAKNMASRKMILLK